MSKKKLIPVVILIVIGICGFWLYSQVISPNTSFPEKEKFFYLPTGSTYEGMLAELTGQDIIRDISSFERICRWKKFHDRIKPGRYRITKNMNNNALVNLLRSGNQEAVLVPVENVKTLTGLAGRLPIYLEGDSAEFARALLDPVYRESLGYSAETFPALFIADRYQMYWNTSPSQFIERMKSVHDQFWTAEKIAKAELLGLNTKEVYTLASIVKAETAKLDEASRIAGLYLNRIRTGMRLQSDPTAIFSSDKEIRRVLLSDLQTDSRYNTYIIDGLPPGPINLVERPYLDAVLDPEDHDYIYMCAKADFSGYHNFSKTYAQHEIFRRQYREALDQRNIHR